MNRITRHVIYTKKDNLPPAVVAPKEHHREHCDMDLLRSWQISEPGMWPSSIEIWLAD
jgi:hypothetical protein